MSNISRRSLLFLRRERREAKSSRAPAEPASPPSSSAREDAALPEPSEEGLDWQRRQGTRAAGPDGLPSVISWLADYMEDDSEPELPRAAETKPLLRPPGAVGEARFLDRCTRCGDCADACPYDAIRPAPSLYREASGTPQIDPNEAPCRVCEDLPCVTACETGALLEDGGRPGVARIRRVDCLNAAGTSCSVCTEHCPVDGAIARTGGVPAIDETLCVGCGVCHYVCPAPQNAVAILPSSDRPTPPARGGSRET